MQVDIARLLIMKVHGGFWADLKLYPVASFLDPLRSHRLVLAEHFVKDGWYPGLPCSAFLGAEPGHAFFDTALSLALASVNERAPHTFGVAGPAALKQALTAHFPCDPNANQAPGFYMLPHTETWDKMFKVGSGSYNGDGNNLHWSQREQQETPYKSSTPEVQPAVTAQDIVAGYQFMLGRKPNEREINMWLPIKSIEALRRDFLKSDEFRSSIAAFGFVPKEVLVEPPKVDPVFKADDVIFMQTADPVVYKEMLDLTSRTAVVYCQQNGFRYESYVGIKRGILPWMAIYNRIFMLLELVQRGYNGWVVYLDADAFVRDLSFDLRSYIVENSEYCFIAAGGGSEAPWDINSGSFLINLADPEGRLLVKEWMDGLMARVPAEYLADPTAKWKAYPSDQDLIYVPLQGIIQRIKKEDNLINYLDGQFISQALRASFGSFEERMDWIRSETDKVLSTTKPCFGNDI
jgi:hypothetical protein